MFHTETVGSIIRLMAPASKTHSSQQIHQLYEPCTKLPRGCNQLNILPSDKLIILRSDQLTSTYHLAATHIQRTKLQNSSESFQVSFIRPTEVTISRNIVKTLHKSITSPFFPEINLQRKSSRSISNMN